MMHTHTHTHIHIIIDRYPACYENDYRNKQIDIFVDDLDRC
jgi:hypothetical protein